jgi:predicted ATP-dependent serine protease
MILNGLGVLQEMKVKSSFSCQECGAVFSKWTGQCGSCLSWNSIREDSGAVVQTGKHERYAGYAGSGDSNITALKEVNVSEKTVLALDALSLIEFLVAALLLAQ